MGQDKAELVLNGSTLLEIAVRKLRSVCGEVVVVGERSGVGADRVLRDRHAGCGPIGGIETALGDVRGEWAMFLPVDMPLLPRGLVEALCATWRDDCAAVARVCMTVANSVVQPLVSVVHRRALATAEDAVSRGQLKVRPMFEAAAARIAADAGMATEAVLRRTEVRTIDDGSSGPGTVSVGQHRIWRPSAAEWRLRHLWFSNLNTPEEFRAAEQHAAALVEVALTDARPSGGRSGILAEEG